MLRFCRRKTDFTVCRQAACHCYAHRVGTYRLSKRLGKDQPIYMLERGMGFALPARGISLGAVVVKATDEWMRSICRRAGRSTSFVAICRGTCALARGCVVVSWTFRGTRFLHQKTRKVLPYVSHF